MFFRFLEKARRRKEEKERRGYLVHIGNGGQNKEHEYSEWVSGSSK